MKNADHEAEIVIGEIDELRTLGLNEDHLYSAIYSLIRRSLHRVEQSTEEELEQDSDGIVPG